MALDCLSRVPKEENGICLMHGEIKARRESRASVTQLGTEPSSLTFHTSALLYRLGPADSHGSSSCTRQFLSDGEGEIQLTR